MDNWTLVKLGEDSAVRRELNRGIAALERAEEPCYRPHACLNGRFGVEVIRRITDIGSRANTEIRLSELLSTDYVRLWLNVRFVVYCDKCSLPDNVVRLSPRQTARIIQGLSPASRDMVLDKVRVWYEKEFKGVLRRGLENLDAQFARGDLLVAGTHDNMVFDIHGDGLGHDTIPYTELMIVGERLAESRHCFGYEANYRRADGLLGDGDW